MFIYTIYDKKACSHSSQFITINDATATRSFARLVNDNRSDVCQFADDFALYCVGELDINTGIVSGFNPVKFICDGSSLIKIDKTE